MNETLWIQLSSEWPNQNRSQSYVKHLLQKTVKKKNNNNNVAYIVKRSNLFSRYFCYTCVQAGSQKEQEKDTNAYTFEVGSHRNCLPYTMAEQFFLKPKGCHVWICHPMFKAALITFWPLEGRTNNSNGQVQRHHYITGIVRCYGFKVSKNCSLTNTKY